MFWSNFYFSHSAWCTTLQVSKDEMALHDRDGRIFGRGIGSIVWNSLDLVSLYLYKWVQGNVRKIHNAVQTNSQINTRCHQAVFGNIHGYKTDHDQVITVQSSLHCPSRKATARTFP